MIGRREFITLLGGVAACPDVARAQQRGKVPRLGVLLFSNPQTDPQMEALRSGLRDLGYDDQSLSIFYRYAEGKPERLFGCRALARKAGFGARARRRRGSLRGQSDVDNTDRLRQQR